MQTIPTTQLAGGEVIVNGQVISEEEIHREAQYHPADSWEQARAEAAQALAIRTLLLAEAERRGIRGDQRQSAESEEEARIRYLLAEVLNNPEPDEDTCRRYFDSNRMRFRAPDQCHVSQIFRPAPADDAEARVAARSRCRRIIRVCQRDLSRFQRLALRHSRCPSAEFGGDMGTVRTGDTCRDFDQALKRLPVGELSPHPLETRYGFHVVWVHAREPGALLSYDAVRDVIARYLRDSVWRRSVSQYVQILAGKARLQGVNLVGAENPLVQ